MKGDIIISKGSILVFPVNGTIWMTSFQIADLFEVHTSTVSNNLKALQKSSMHYQNMCYEEKTKDNITTWYNLDLIIALAFRLTSAKTMYFRWWIAKRIASTSLEALSQIQPTSLN